MQLNRVVHLTLEKCGSQWVRDVLSAPEIINYSKKPHSGVSISMGNVSELNIPNQTFTGPIYGMNRWDWDYWNKPGDKAIVVLRDPRDVLVSMMYSWLYSHGSNDHIDLARKMLHESKNPNEQLSFMISVRGDNSTLRMYRTWAKNNNNNNALLVSYEDLVGNQYESFKKIVNWLEWNVPDEVLMIVINRLSFESRSGRKPGETDKFSHLRRGVANDWRNHFTRSHGQLWEKLYPGLLREIGYEDSDEWWKKLDENTYHNETSEIDSKDELIYSLEQKLKNIQMELIAKEKVIQELVVARNLIPNAQKKNSFLDRVISIFKTDMERK